MRRRSQSKSKARGRQSAYYVFSQKIGIKCLLYARHCQVPEVNKIDKSLSSRACILEGKRDNI